MAKPLRSLVNRVFRSTRYDLLKREQPNRVLEVLTLLRPFDVGVPLIRLGSEADGGYLLPDDLQGISACLSPGVADRASFEADLEARGIVSILADASVSKPPMGCEHMPFERKFLGLWNDDIYTTPDAWVSRWPQASSGDLMMQMDVEGAEWGLLASISESLLSRFRILILELHGLEAAGQPFANRIMREVLARLHREFICVHLHPNNNEPIVHVGSIPVPSAIEVTYLRRDRVRQMRPRTDFPHQLDRDNVRSRPQITLPSIWFEDRN